MLNKNEVRELIDCVLCRIVEIYYSEKRALATNDDVALARYRSKLNELGSYTTSCVVC